MLTRFAESNRSQSSESELRYLLPDQTPAQPEVAVVVARPGDAIRDAGGTLGGWVRARIFQLGDGAPADLDRVIEAGFTTRKEYAVAWRERIESALDRRPTELGFESGRLAQNMATITLALADIFRRDWPDIVLTQAYEGNDPDEDTAAFAVQCACALLANEGHVAPTRLEFAGSGGFTTHPYAEAVAVRLDERQRIRKAEMCAQLELPAHDVELFRVAPVYDFSLPPHARQLQYEARDGNGITGARWRRLAGEALRVLGLTHG